MTSGSFKGPPQNKKIYECYKNFDIANFSNTLKGNLEKVNDNSHTSFENIFLNALNIDVPLKTRMLRFNNGAFMTKKLREEIMKRSKLKNNFNKKRSHENWCKYKPQRNYCVNLLRKSKRQYFSNISDVTDNKSFWKFVKPDFSNKGLNSNKIALVENDTIITNDRVMSKTMNKFFINTNKKLNLKPFKNSADTDINQITSVFQNHVSIRKIQQCFPNIKANDFNSRQVFLKEVKSEILNLSTKKSSTKGSMPATI